MLVILVILVPDYLPLTFSKSVPTASVFFLKVWHSEFTALRSSVSINMFHVPFEKKSNGNT